jgi:drug/metabolite transporter (DMT)-like permease
LGNSLFVLNAMSYGAYLVVAKQLIAKYPPVTLLRWLFTIAFVISAPLTWGEFTEIDWIHMPLWVYGVILYVIVLTTFGTYILNAYAMTQLRASTVGAFIYLQPLLGIGFAIGAGKDRISWISAMAGAAIMFGVYLASKPISRKVSH